MGSLYLNMMEFKMKDLIYDNKLYCFEVFVSVRKLDNGVVLIDAPSEENCHLVRFLALPPKFDIVSQVLEESTYMNHVTGEAFIRTSILYKNILKHAIKIIDVVDSDIDQINIEKTNFGDLNYNLVKAVCKKWLKDVL